MTRKYARPVALLGGCCLVFRTTDRPHGWPASNRPRSLALPARLFGLGCTEQEPRRWFACLGGAGLSFKGCCGLFLVQTSVNHGACCLSRVQTSVNHGGCRLFFACTNTNHGGCCLFLVQTSVNHACKDLFAPPTRPNPPCGAGFAQQEAPPPRGEAQSFTPPQSNPTKDKGKQPPRLRVEAGTSGVYVIFFRATRKKVFRPGNKSQAPTIPPAQREKVSLWPPKKPAGG
jgi:hypothetical protein